MNLESKHLIELSQHLNDFVPIPLVDCLHHLNTHNQEIKNVINTIAMALQQWESQRDIEFKVDQETNLSLEYGNKHARLVEQAMLFEKILQPGVRVPFPKGCSNSTIQAFLKDSAPEVQEQWDKLETLYQQFQTTGEPAANFLKQPEISDILKIIHKSIEEAFLKNDAISKLDISDDLFTWMEELKEKNCYLMVRSSGAEDTRNTANAGGNISVAYVNPEPQALCNALGKVVASYFWF